MKISELVQYLNKLEASHGDAEVFMHTREYGKPAMRQPVTIQLDRWPFRKAGGGTEDRMVVVLMDCVVDQVEGDI